MFPVVVIHATAFSGSLGSTRFLFLLAYCGASSPRHIFRSRSIYWLLTTDQSNLSNSVYRQFLHNLFILLG